MTSPLPRAARHPLLAPNHAEVRPTNACQLDCVGCWYYSPHVAPRPPAWQRAHLSLETLGPLFEDLADVGFKRLIVSGGGEPFAYPAIFELLEMASARMDALLISNLLLCKDPDRLARSRVKEVLANFNAGTPGVYSLYHPNQREEAFERLLAILRRVARGVKVTLSCVLGRVNCEDVPQMLRVAKETTGRIQFKQMRTVTAAVMTDAQRTELRAQLPRLADAADALGLVHNLRKLELDHDRPPVESVSCWAGYFTSVIDADGAVKLCCQPEQDDAATATSLGNVNERRFRDIWTSPEYAAERDALEARRFHPWCAGCVTFPHNRAITKAIDLSRGGT